MKLLVVSDNHGDEFLMNEIYSLYDEEVEVWLHCGDSEFDEFHPLWNSYTTVLGNMDITNAFETELVNHFKDVKYVQVHGHLHQVKRSLDQLADLAKKNDAQFAFYGHTHIPKVDYEDSVYLINPGSLTQPKGGYKKGSYAIVDIDDEEGSIDFYDTDHNKIDELSQKLTF